MAEGGATRRLTTIVAADVAGYSRLMGTDEEATLAALRGHRKELIDPNIAEHGGRIANTAGDSILIEFPSVVEALRSAIDIQRGMAARNSEEPEDRRIAFRIGVNVGDVMEQDGDLLGDGVNVAARLEGLAEPGGICVSARVWEDVRDKLEIGFQDRGEQTLKNIARPVRVYRVLLDRAAAKTGTAPPRPQSWLPWTAAVVVVLAILVGGLVWWQPWLKWLDPAPLSEADGIKAETAGTAAPSDKAALPLPDKPSVAVLPFQNISGDPEQTYFADGITEDIITDLSKLSGLFVIARNSSFRYRGGAHDLKQVGAELGVKFVLEGSVRRAGNTVRINAQLIEAATGGHLWAERYDGTL
ncbi:MAG: adenylate/guanylate cyclase domain-containing protein, partial [Alphaproteobacteria bacterium]